jgi:V/A-type H+-transporting ATPase subunit C
MVHNKPEQAVLDFYTYPPVGEDDWQYGHQTARVRMLEMQMLSQTMLQDMTSAETFHIATDLLASTEYVLPHSAGRLTAGGGSIAQVEKMLLGRRSAVRELFADLMLDKPIVHLFKTRDDFANLRLGLRRMLTGKPVGSDYSNDGNVPPELYERVFKEENYELLPDYMQQAVDEAVLAYYQNKDVRQIDYAIDRFQAEYNLIKAHEMKSIFLLGLFRVQIDLTNIRTMLRLKFTGSEQRNVFLEGGYVQPERFETGLALGYESLGTLFFATPYHKVVEIGANYLSSDKSFLKAEQQCEQFLHGFLKTTAYITTGPQPIIAYLLMKENEIRTVRLILTAKKNSLDTRLVLDRIGE